MARTIKQIQDLIIAELISQLPNLSMSVVAEWRLWTHVTASAIQAFELVLDVFKREVADQTDRITPGTVRWYAEMCYRFQNGYELVFDNKTAMLYYPTRDPAAQIVKVVAIKEIYADSANNLKPKLVVKAAKFNDSGKIVPLSDDEKNNFKGYIDSVKFAGVQTEVTSTTEDKVRYGICVFFDPAFPSATVKLGALSAIEAFKTTIGFDSYLYKQKFLDAIMSVPGVVTVHLDTMTRKGTSDESFSDVSIRAELESGYFEYDSPHCSITMTSIKDIENVD